MRAKTNQWHGGPRKSVAYRMDMLRKAKDEPDNKPKGWVRPTYVKKPKKAGYSIRKGYKRRS